MTSRITFRKSACVILTALWTLAFFATTQAKEQEIQATTITSEGSPPAETSASGFLGVVPRQLDHVMRAALDYDEPGGLLSQVIRDSPAEKAGLVVGDILVKLNSKSVHDPDWLMSLMRDLRAGDAVDLVLMHGGKGRTVKVTLVSRPTPRLLSWNGEGHADVINLQDLLEQELENLHGDQTDVDVELEGLEQELEGLKINGSDSPVHKKVRIMRNSPEEPVYN